MLVSANVVGPVDGGFKTRSNCPTNIPVVSIVSTASVPLAETVPLAVVVVAPR